MSSYRLASGTSDTPVTCLMIAVIAAIAVPNLIAARRSARVQGAQGAAAEARAQGALPPAALLRAALSAGVPGDELQRACVAAVGTYAAVFLPPGDLPDPHARAAALAVAEGWLLLEVEQDALAAIALSSTLPGTPNPDRSSP